MCTTPFLFASNEVYLACFDFTDQVMCANAAFFPRCPLAEKEKTRRGVVISSMQKASFQWTSPRKEQCFKASLHQPSFKE